MKTKTILWIAGILILSLAACSATPAAQAAGSATGPSAEGTHQPGQRTLNTETKLLLGTFKLEGTDQAVTKDQAAELLPLWKAVKTLSTSETTSTEEIDALYQQIHDTMTDEQIKAIDAMGLTYAAMNEVMQQAGITPEAGFGAFSGTASPEQQATREALRAQGGFSGGDFPGGAAGGAPGAGSRTGGGGTFSGGGGFPAGGGFTGGERSGQTGEASGQFATAIAGRSGAMGLRVDEPLVNALISLLEQRAG